MILSRPLGNKTINNCTSGDIFILYKNIIYKLWKKKTKQSSVKCESFKYVFEQGFPGSFLVSSWFVYNSWVLIYSEINVISSKNPVNLSCLNEPLII